MACRPTSSGRQLVRDWLEKRAGTLRPPEAASDCITHTISATTATSMTSVSTLTCCCMMNCCNSGLACFCCCDILTAAAAAAPPAPCTACYQVLLLVIASKLVIRVGIRGLQQESGRAQAGRQAGGSGSDGRRRRHGGGSPNPAA